MGARCPENYTNAGQFVVRWHYTLHWRFFCLKYRSARPGKGKQEDIPAKERQSRGHRVTHNGEESCRCSLQEKTARTQVSMFLGGITLHAGVTVFYSRASKRQFRALNTRAEVIGSLTRATRFVGAYEWLDEMYVEDVAVLIF